MRRLLFLLIFLILADTGRGAETFDFLIVQPGQPGTPAEAQPVLEALAGYLEGRLGPGVTVRGEYVNDLEEARARLRRSRPRWGIVSLGFFAEFSREMSMMPIAATRPGGLDQDQWRLAVPLDAPDAWQSLGGPLHGSPLFTREAAACLLFGRRAGELPFPLEGTAEPLRALRRTAAGESGGTVLDRVQWQAMQRLPLAAQVKVIHVSRELPTSPVVWFGPEKESAGALAAVLRQMGGDPQAKNLLRLLQTDGFGPPDPDLSRWEMDDQECPK